MFRGTMASAEHEPITGVWGQSPQRGPDRAPGQDFGHWMSNGACKFSPFLKMSSNAGNGLTVDLSALRKLKHNLDNITSQKWGARHIGEPLDHKCGGCLSPWAQ